MTEDTAKPSDSEFTDQQTTVSVSTACTTDKVDGPDSTGSTGHACLPSKFSGSDLPSEETFEEWITHFELVAGVHKWNAQAKLIHLITRLRHLIFIVLVLNNKNQATSCW